MHPHFQRAMLLKSANRTEDAVRELREGLAHSPEDGFGWGLLGICLGELGRVQEALEAVREGVRVSPDDEYNHYALGVVHADRGEFGPAGTAALEAIRLAPEDANNHSLLARIRSAEGRWAEALEATDAGLALDAENTACLYLRSTVLAKLGRHDEARATLATLSRLQPDTSISHHARAYSLLEQGDFAGARSHFLEALRVDPTDDDARQGLLVSLRAKHAVYGLAIRGLLWLARFRSGQRWAIWGGVVAVLLIAQRLEQRYPDLAPLLVLVKAAWWIVVIGSVLATPLFNLVLRLDREGRQALSPDEVRATNWQLPCILLATGFGVLAARGGGLLWFGWAFVFVSLTLLVGEYFTATAAWVRSRLRWLGLGVLFAPLFSVCLLVFALSLPRDLARPLIIAVPFIPVLASLPAFYADDIRQWLERRKPDDPPHAGRPA